jgi:hypothetical protein
MRLFIGKRVGPVYVGVGSSFHPARVLLHHGADPVPAPVAWLVVLCCLITGYSILSLFFR